MWAFTVISSMQKFIVSKNNYSKCIQTEKYMKLMLHVVSKHDSSIFHHFTVAFLIVQLGLL
jgi:hypothetical protein